MGNEIGYYELSTEHIPYRVKEFWNGNLYELLGIRPTRRRKNRPTCLKSDSFPYNPQLFADCKPKKPTAKSLN